MHYVIELWFDEKSELQLKAVWDALLARGISNDTVKSGGKPHITLTSTIGNPSTSPELAKIIESRNLFKVKFGEVCSFPGNGGIFYLSVLPNDFLITLHSEICECVLAEGLHNDLYYQPDQIVFHSTLASGLSLMQGKEVHWNTFDLPSEAEIIKMAVVEYKPAKTLKEWTLTKSAI